VAAKVTGGGPIHSLYAVTIIQKTTKTKQAKTQTKTTPNKKQTKTQKPTKPKPRQTPSNDVTGASCG